MRSDAHGVAAVVLRACGVAENRFLHKRTQYCLVSVLLKVSSLPAINTKGQPVDELDAMAIALMLTTELAVAVACVAAWFRERVLAAF